MTRRRDEKRTQFNWSLHVYSTQASLISDMEDWHTSQHRYCLTVATFASIYSKSSGGFRPSDRAGGGHVDPEIRGSGLKNNVLARRVSVWSKNKSGPSPGSATQEFLW